MEALSFRWLNYANYGRIWEKLGEVFLLWGEFEVVWEKLLTKEVEMMIVWGVLEWCIPIIAVDFSSTKYFCSLLVLQTVSVQTSDGPQTFASLLVKLNLPENNFSLCCATKSWFNFMLFLLLMIAP
jgi:hypothetical protein